MNKFIVTGQMRSGTTFFANFLNSQDEIVCYADFIRSPYKVAKGLQLKNYEMVLDDEERNILYSEFKAECDLFRIQLYKNFSKDDFATFKDFLDCCYESLAIYEGNRPLLVGNKITEHDEQVLELLNHGYLIFYLMRDPRDVVLSSRNRFANHNTINRINKWKETYNLLKQYEHPNLVKIRYEDIINKNSKLITEIEDCLNLKLNFNLNALKLRDNIEYNDNSSFLDLDKLFDPSAVFRWKKSPNDDDVNLASSILMKEINELNYDKGDYAASFGSILRYQKSILFLKIKRVIKSIVRS